MMRWQTFIGLFMAAAVAVVAGVVLWVVWPFPTPKQSALRAVKHWDYQLQQINLDRLAQSASDLVVMDYSRNGTGAGAYTRADVERVRLRPDGSRRLVIAYLSIGEAEEYRYYWQAAWKETPPDWLFAENCRWPGNHMVRYWMAPWKAIIFEGTDSYLSRIIAAGFDGVYLDRVDAYWDLREQHPEGRTAMIGFVRQFAERARAMKSDILIVAQNAEDLLSDAKYRRSIDAIAKEDLIHGVKASGERNDNALIIWSLAQLQLLKSERKPVFVVEYLQRLEHAAATKQEILSHGFGPVFPPRALDGRDPFDLLPAAPVVVAASPQTGTPEYGIKHCK